MSEVGHNLPPSMTTTAGEIMRDLSGWLSEHPVIQDETEAKEAKIFIDRARLGLKDLEDERVNLVKPLNQQLEQINEHYRQPRDTLRKVLDELERRVTGFLTAEEARHRQDIAEAKRVAEAAEVAAREAERQELAVFEQAKAGELGLDVAAVTLEANAKFETWKKAKRAEIREEREKVTLPKGLTRPKRMRDYETLVVTDVVAAVQVMKDSDRIIEAVRKSAPSYQKVYGHYPPGIEVKIERKL